MADVAANLVMNSQRLAAARERSMRCGRCRHEYAAEAWERLEVVGRMVADSLRGLVTSWPEGVAIEIRQCHACGCPIARKHTRG